MPINPTRSYQGGDVEGTAMTDIGYGQGKPIEVAKASFDPGYSLESTLSDGGTVVSAADLKLGYCGYGKSTGEE